MLVLHYAFQKCDSDGKSIRDKITRLHFLSALFEEAYKYLQNHLCASILCIRIYTMPFCRDVNLDMASIDKMKNAINDCLVCGGAFIVAPEHRLSLELKTKELHRRGENNIAACIENYIIKHDIWRDILDECDEVLRHRYQLIYAMGDSVPLPAGDNRWRAVQAVFSALAQNDCLREYLASHSKACKLLHKPKSEWPGLQIFDGEALSSMLNGLFPQLADVLLSNPPYELEWVLDHPLKDDIRKAIIKEESFPALEKLPEQQLSYILALRGFIAGGVLRHCLLKRHRVDFGVARPGKKRLAVPFRAADTPDERAEFAHPECAIGFTVLSYYHDGLTRLELMQAFKRLTSLGKIAQDRFYDNMFSASSEQMKAEDFGCFESLDRIEKIDMTNKTQMEKMWHFYQHNMYAVNFYLNYCVLPDEMDQFDSG